MLLLPFGKLSSGSPPRKLLVLKAASRTQLESKASCAQTRARMQPRVATLHAGCRSATLIQQDKNRSMLQACCCCFVQTLPSHKGDPSEPDRIRAYPSLRGHVLPSIAPTHRANSTPRNSCEPI